MPYVSEKIKDKKKKINIFLIFKLFFKQKNKKTKKSDFQPYRNDKTIKFNGSKYHYVMISFRFYII